MCYTEHMNDEIYTPTDDDIISVLEGDMLPPDVEQGVKRTIAEAMRKRADMKGYFDSIGKKMTNKDYLALMLWDIITNGEFHFADGTTFHIDDYAEWLQTVKFMSMHLDGNATTDNPVGVNVFKVYMGFDEDKV